MKYKNYSSEGFEDIRALSISFAISLFVLLLIGLPIQGVWKRYYLLFTSFLASLYLMIPGIVMFTRPWISQAWLHALHSRIIPDTPWEELLGDMKVFIFLGSSISLLAGILIFILSVLNI